MTYGLWKCHCGYETPVDTDHMPPIQERCANCNPKPRYGTREFSARMYEQLSKWTEQFLHGEDVCPCCGEPITERDD